MNGAPLYRASTDQPLLSRTWGMETVVYNPVSGDTHLLDSQGANLLGQILRSPSTYHDLKQWLAATIEGTGDGVEDELDGYLAFTLNQFIQLGLIEIARDKGSP